MAVLLFYLSSIGPFVASATFIAMPFGQQGPAQTLVPIRPSVTSSLHVNDTALHPNSILDESKDNASDTRSVLPVDPPRHIGSAQRLSTSMLDEGYTATQIYEEYEQYDNIERTEALYVEVGSTDFQTLVQRASVQAPTKQRKPTDAGTMQIDCLLAPEVCNNVCWYQNCVYGQKGQVEYPTYQIGGNNKGANRVTSGVITSKGPPCRSLPFGQKFYDTFPFTEFDLFDETPPKKTPKGKDKQDPHTFLDTDEWPMADFEQGPWIDGVQQHVLRCMTSYQNQMGQAAYSTFKAGKALYNKEKSGQPRAWAAYRNIPPGEKLIRYDSFKVQPNFDSFKPTGDKEEDEKQDKILETIQWCRPIKGHTNIECKNDGRQFHMTGLVTNGLKASQGYLSEPYSSKVSSRYQIDDMDGNGKDIQQYHVMLSIEGDEVSAEVKVYDKQIDKDQKGEWKYKGKVLATRDGSNGEDLVMKDGDSFEIKGDLPRTLTVRRQLDRGSGCGTFQFTYADAQREPLRAFRFHSRNKGHPDTKGLYPNNMYCDEESIEDEDANGNIIVIATTIYCSFPGW